ncbi:Ankyrin-3 [Termitomyces sp. T112]|nr:Ankyrin-3 [Termitomyces sp. T112]
MSGIIVRNRKPFVVARRVSRSPRVDPSWLKNMLIVLDSIRDAPDLLRFPDVQLSARIVHDMLLIIKTARKNLDDFEGLSQKLVNTIRTVLDAVRICPQNQTLPYELCHRCSGFMKQLSAVQASIHELVRQNNSWRSFLRTRTTLDAIGQFKMKVDSMQSDFTLESVIRIYMEAAKDQRPRQIVHCLYINDAMNKHITVPMTWCPSFNALDSLIKYRFRGHSGYSVVETGDFSLTLKKADGTQVDLHEDNSDTWLHFIEPGVIITMDILFKDKKYGEPNSMMCPSCHNSCIRGFFGEYVECLQCETVIENWMVLDGDAPLYVNQDKDKVATPAMQIGPLVPSNLPANLNSSSTEGLRVNDDNYDHSLQSFRRFRVTSHVYHVLPTLHSTALEGSSDAVGHLLEDNTIVNTTKDYHGRSPLHLAALRGHLNTAQLLLNHNTHVDATDEWEETPLHTATIHGHLDIIKLLLNHNADVNAKNRWRSTPLHKAIAHGHLNAAKLLLNYDADVHCKDNHKRTPLHLAAKRPNLNFAELLLNYKADVHARDYQGATPLHWAVRLGHLKTVQYLLSHDADVHATNNRGKTPLDYAWCYDHSTVASFLLDNMNTPRCS